MKPDYEQAYYILMSAWDEFHHETKTKFNEELKKVGL